MLQKIKDFNKKIRWWIIILSIFGIIIIPILIITIINFYPLATFSLRTVRPVADFEYKDTLTCTIIYNTHKGSMSFMKMPWYDYDTFTLTDLNTDNPKLLVNGEQKNRYAKDYEGKNHLTLSTDPPHFSTDNISLMKNTGSFVRTITGSQAGSWKFHYAIAQKGRCE